MRLLRQNHRELSTTRKILFIIVLITFCGNFIPITIDTAAIWGNYVRNRPATLGLMYALSNATTAAISSAGWWFLYKMIEKEGNTMHTEHKAERKRIRDKR